ncbi:uncharacterized mitochondrial protein AtMg00810-like [Prosopis cineraria]|uniref:uncharacterized mitochondrial protein AtMg00810-like n=1 Tax=Prosopis cineraria TaxID=364024 RepID=UPI00240F5483|nr:uncharacterized mitochondrial protein AtMg00810-like [Prosopis cineraria]
MVLGQSLSKFDSSPLPNLSDYHQVVGTLQSLAHTCPDISFTVSKLGQFLSAPTLLYWQATCPDDRWFTSGYLIFLGDALVSWSSKKQAVVACSSAESEYYSLAHTAFELCGFDL